MRMQHIVAGGDTPSSIARAYTGTPTRMRELIQANGDKPAIFVHGVKTFRSLHAGERLNLPGTWTDRFIPRGSLGQFFALGQSTSDMDNIVGSATSNQLLQTATDLISALGGASGTSADCTNSSIMGAVSAFQSQADSTGASRAATGTTLGVDGKYGPSTQIVLDAVIGATTRAGISISTQSAPAALFVTGICANVNPPAPPAPPPAPPTPPTPPTPPSTTSSSLSPLLIGALVLAGGLGAFAIYKKRQQHPAAAGHPARMAAHHASRTPHSRRLAHAR